MTKRLLPLLCMLLVSISAMAQSKYTVKGTIVDKTNEPMVGVTVLEKGTSNAAITDVNGAFVLNVPSGENVIQVRYIGYATLEYQANNSVWSSPIVLQEDAVNIEGVVVIGYGTTTRKDATGSVAAITVDEVNKGVVTSPQDLIKGKIAGVVVTSNSGMPGSGSTIRIRGGSSLTASNDPLIVIDGIPIDNRQASGMADQLAALNPNDIETFTVLKDASAAAIYGSRASNGVVIITTKKGKYGSIQVNYSGSMQVNTVSKYNDVMNATEFKQFMKDNYGENAVQFTGLGNADTDWQKEVLRTSVSTDHHVSVAGSTKNMPYRVSLGYFDDQGIIKNSGFQRTSIGLGAKPTILDGHMTIDMNVQGTYVNNKFVNEGIVAAAAAFDPTRPVRISPEVLPTDEMYKNGRGYFFFLNPATGVPISVAPENPVDRLLSRDDKANVLRSIGSAKVDYRVHGFEDLTATLDLGYDVTKAKGDTYYPDYSTMTLRGDGGQGRTGNYEQALVNQLLDAYLTYNSSFKSKSKFNVMLGYSWQRAFTIGNNYETNNYYEDKNPFEKKVFGDNSYATHSTIVSFFGRANYTLNNKYILTGTLRNDGSSRFKEKWGLFPSGAFAWKISEENFLKQSKTLSDLKLRLGYGATGQQDISGNDYPYMPQYTYSQPRQDYWMGSDFMQTLRPDAYDENIKWERTITYNVGLDYGFFGDRLWGAVDLYFRKTNDLLSFVPVPALTNLTNGILTNVGNLENKGIEFSINAVVIDTKDFQWDINLNATLSNTKVTKLTASDDPNYQGVETGGISGGNSNKVQIHTVGYAPGTFYLYEQVYDQNGKPLDNVYVDQNGDGLYNDADRVRRRSPQAPAQLGMSTRLTYKNWDMGMNAHASIGNYVYNNRASDGEPILGAYATSGYYTNRMRSISNSGFMDARYYSDYYLEDGSFLRLDNVTLAYTFKKIFHSKIDARLSFVVNNVAIWTKYTGLDPEVFNGIENSAYPRPRTYMMSLNLKF